MAKKTGLIGAFPATRWIFEPETQTALRWDKELAAIPAKVGMKARFMEDEEAMSMVDGMAKKDTQLLRLLVDSLEKCMKSGDKR